MKWHELFYFTKRERIGFSCIILLLFTGIFFYRLRADFSSASTNSFASQDSLLVAYEQQLAQIEANKKKKRAVQRTTVTSAITVMNLHAFNPNTVDSTTLVQMGLSPYLARNILRYRSKGGVFRTKESVSKIYGMDEKTYLALQPYIRIESNKDSVKHKSSIQFEKKEAQLTEKQVKMSPGTTIDLNSADTLSLKRIPGIGSSIAQQIVSYRYKLGGFYAVEQLKEIHLKSELLSPWFTLSPNAIQKIKVNYTTARQLSKHPYLNFYQAKIIAEHRKKYGQIQAITELSLYEEFTPEDLERLSFYLDFNLE